MSKTIPKPSTLNDINNSDIKNKTLQIAQKTEITTGPLPHPIILEGYEKIVPGSAERIINNAENQQKHRMRLEDLAITSELKQSERGQIFALIIALLGLGGGIFLIYSGHDLAGGSIAGVSLVSLVGTFLHGKKEIRKDIEKKRER